MQNIKHNMTEKKIDRKVESDIYTEKEKEREKKNWYFTQVSKDKGWQGIRALVKENPNAAAIFTFLCEKMDKYNALVCSMKVLEEVTGKGRTTCSNAIKYLKKNGYIDILKSGTTNVYVLNPDIVWENDNNKKPYCEFAGKILISKEENKAFTQNVKAKRRVVLDQKKQ